MSVRRRVILLVLPSLLLGLIGFAAGYRVRAEADAGNPGFPLVSEAYRLLSAHFLGELPPRLDLERGMVRGLLEADGDPYTIYVAPAAHELETDLLSGEYGGIGATLSRDEAGRVRLIPFVGGPAALAGVREGDILLAVDGHEILPQDSLDTALAELRGPAGTQVTLRLAARGAGGEAIEVTITRQVTPLPSVNVYLLPDEPRLGVIAVTVFSERTLDELHQGLEDLAARGALAFVLDLRANPGGLFDAAVEGARLFLSEGVVASERRAGGAMQVHRVDGPGDAADVPLAVLVDAGTASAAEVAAAALQENGRAPLIGQQTLGKGSVQLIFELSDGSSLHITTSRWLTPNGSSLDGRGLEPDVAVEATSLQAGDPYLAAARSWFASQGVLTR
ncbi:MAG: S41 family peptidase [Chloroflexota bacterium]